MGFKDASFDVGHACEVIEHSPALHSSPGGIRSSCWRLPRPLLKFALLSPWPFQVEKIPLMGNGSWLENQDLRVQPPASNKSKLVWNAFDSSHNTLF